MWFATVETVSGVGARFPLGSRRCGRYKIGFTLATSCKGTVVILAVWAHTDGADNTERAAVVEVMTPNTTPSAVRGAYLRRRLTEKTNHTSNIDGVVDESTHPRPLLGVPDVEIDGACVRIMGIANDPRRSSKPDVILVNRREEDTFSIPRGKTAPNRSNEGDVDEFTERSRRGDSASNCGGAGD